MNKVIMSGNVTRDPECGKTNNDIAYCRFCIAVQRDLRDSDGNRNADFFNCITWRKTAEFCSKHLKKGTHITIFGRIISSTYETSEGNKRVNIEIVVEEADIAFSRANESVENSQATNDRLTAVDDDDLPF